MTVCMGTDRERECRRLLEDARELVERLARVAQRLPTVAAKDARDQQHFRAMTVEATTALAMLRGKIEDAEALVRQWGK